jgi:hypothetical protein
MINYGRKKSFITPDPGRYMTADDSHLLSRRYDPPMRQKKTANDVTRSNSITTSSPPMMSHGSIPFQPFPTIDVTLSYYILTFFPPMTSHGPNPFQLFSTNDITGSNSFPNVFPYLGLMKYRVWQGRLSTYCSPIYQSLIG